MPPLAPQVVSSRTGSVGLSGERVPASESSSDVTRDDDATRRVALGALGCGCIGCAAAYVGLDRESPVDVFAAKAVEASRAKDERFARVMRGGMQDYEAWDEVVAFKTALFENVRRGDLCVEIGIGGGPNLHYYGARAKKVVAVEPNLAFDEFASAEARATGTTLEVREGVAEAIPFPDGSVDVVVGTMVLCSVQNVAASLAEVRRVLKPGGRYLFSEHTKAPDDWALLTAAQTVASPLQLALANGCHLRRDPLPEIERAFRRVDARSFVLSNTGRGPPWPPHFLLAPHVVGVATKAS